MIRQRRNITFSLFLSLSLGWLASSCHDEQRNESTIHAVEGTLDPKPIDVDAIEAQLKRYAGQTEFLNIASNLYLPIAAEAAGDDAGGQQSGREIQEADLFKVGKDGSKLLYVLNPYRGLQVIDFSAGSNNPQRVGRTDATGNEVLEMIFDENHMQIVVLERSWLPQGGAQGFLQVYSVADPTRPQLKQSVTLKGDIADSRQVGDIFYVATSRWANFQSIGGEGFVTSYSLEADGLREVESYQLALPVSGVGQMNIVETEEEGSFRYHLISVLSENRWGWWDRQSTVELVDISDTKGLIKPVIMVSTKGQLRERSGTHIKDGTLIAVSNSWSEGDNPIRRVSVESFTLPKDRAETIDHLEAEFRRLWFEKKMREKPAQLSSDDYAELLNTDPEYGLKGRFVEQLDGRLTKVIPDHTVTVGDTTGLHAELQDVRFVEDRLYVFWVPANQVDPLDIFDISSPQTDLRYIGRTFFDGWIERAVPFQYQGQDYVLGLGWIVPAVGENPTRRPQAMIFKLPEGEALAPQAQIIAQLTLSSGDLSASFNEPDKSIEIRNTGDGQGLIIFPAYSWGPSAKSGGKIIAYDMSSEKSVLSEGGFLQADAAWLRRVFSNPEIDKMHALSDRALSTFDLNPANYGSADQIFEAIFILEMARDIRAFDTVSFPKANYGMQFVEGVGARFEDANTELRVILSERADSDSVLRRVTLPGRYESHVVSRNGDIYALNRETRIEMNDGFESWKQSLVLTRIRIQGEKGLLESPELSRVEWGLSSESLGYWGLYGALRAQLYEEEDKLVVSQGDHLTLVLKGDQLQLGGPADTACLPEGRLSTEFKFLNNAFYVTYDVEVKTVSGPFDNVRLSRAFLAPLSDTFSVQCAEAINIPGKALRLEGDRLVTEDQRFLGFSMEEGALYPVNTMPLKKDAVDSVVLPPYRWPNTARVLSGLSLAGKGAVLKDLYALPPNVGEVLVEDALYTLEQVQEWSPRFLSKIAFNGERFERVAYTLPSAQTPYSWPQLTAVLDSERGPLFLIQEGTQAKIYAVEGDHIRALEVRVVREHELSSASSNFLLPEWLDPVLKDQRIDFDGVDRLAIAQGLYGVIEVQLAN